MKNIFLALMCISINSVAIADYDSDRQAERRYQERQDQIRQDNKRFEEQRYQKQLDDKRYGEQLYQKQLDNKRYEEQRYQKQLDDKRYEEQQYQKQQNKICVTGACQAPLTNSPGSVGQSVAPTKPTQKLPSGYNLFPCGCWGQVLLGFQINMEVCVSGTGTVTACPGFCPGGGSMWHAVCD